MNGVERALASLALAGIALGSAAALAHASEPVAGQATVPAPDPASLDLARQILKIAFPPKKRPALFAGVMQAMVKQIRTALAKELDTGDPDANALIDRQTKRVFALATSVVQSHTDDYFEAMAHAYAREFSPDDLHQILAFVQTPTGQKFFLRSSKILQDPDVAAASKRMMDDMVGKMPALQSEMQRDIEQFIKRRKAEHRQSGVAS